jgi:fatty acid desaturase
MSSSNNVEVAPRQSLLPTLLLVLFVALKLTGVITWSWWWVLAPLWIPLGLILVVLLVVGVFVLVGRK